jgi:hypothetical protein
MALVLLITAKMVVDVIADKKKKKKVIFEIKIGNGYEKSLSLKKIKQK